MSLNGCRERLAELDRMEASVHERLDPLRREVEKRVVEAEDIRERLKHAETGFAGVRLALSPSPFLRLRPRPLPVPRSRRLVGNSFALESSRPGQFIDSTRAGMRLTRVREAEHRKANVTRDLVAERGYATDATSKVCPTKRD